MSTNETQGQKNTPSNPESSEKYHVVCRDCTHEELVDSRDAAHDDARAHAKTNPNHTVSYGRICQEVSV